MKATERTPPIVVTALWVNVGLLVLALAGPRLFSGGMDAAAGAALMFVIPMTLILVVGAAAAIAAFILARREGQRVKWTAFLPVGMFVVGIAATMGMVYWGSA